jgi:hypothetical protein|tara:strand:- start:139 stop:1008 length:870 start_codon:yes stop_codon:yes gene_type:complete
MTKKKKSYIDMYNHHLNEIQKIDKNVNVIFDTTEDEVDWLRKNRKQKREEKKNKKYEKAETIKILDKILNAKNNISQLYNDKIVNRSGMTVDTKEYYTEVISGRLLEEIKGLKDSIVPIDRKKGYRVDSHRKVISKTDTNRDEENMAKNLLWTNIDYLGRIIDFQVPLKDKDSDNAGKIDLISFKDGESPISYIVELKIENNNETLLRAALEIFTYYCQLNKENFIKSFEEYKHLEPKDIKKAVLLEEGSLAHNEYCEKKLRNRPKLKTLIKELDIDIFSFKLNVEKLC